MSKEPRPRSAEKRSQDAYACCAGMRTPSAGSVDRRDALKRIGAGAAALALPSFVLRSSAGQLVVAGQPAELSISAVSPVTVRLTVRAIGAQQTIPFTGALAQDEFGPVAAHGSDPSAFARARVGDLFVSLNSPSAGVDQRQANPTILVETARGELIQRLTLDAAAPGMTLRASEGSAARTGRRRSAVRSKGNRRSDAERPGRVSSRDAWHARAGAVADRHRRLGDVHSPAVRRVRFHRHRGASSRQRCCRRREISSSTVRIPVAAARTSARRVRRRVEGPAVIMREYARITGLPEMPARWTLGYQQSHRTLAGPDEITGRRADDAREEAAMRHTHLSRHRVHAVGMEHEER